ASSEPTRDRRRGTHSSRRNGHRSRRAYSATRCTYAASGPCWNRQKKAETSATSSYPSRGVPEAHASLSPGAVGGRPRGNTEGTPPRAPASTRDHASSDDSFVL